MTSTQDAAQRLERFSLWGARAALVAAAVMAVAICASLVMIALGSSLIEEELILDFDVGDLTQSLTTLQIWGTGLLWLVPDAIGLAMVIVTYKLFQGLRREGVFTHLTAARLRLMGWCIFAFAPARILCYSLGAGFVAATNTPASGRIHLSIEDSDFYAVVIGLTLISLGYIMSQAVDISDENKSFV